MRVVLYTRISVSGLYAIEGNGSSRLVGVYVRVYSPFRVKERATRCRNPGSKQRELPAAAIGRHFMKPRMNGF